VDLGHEGLTVWREKARQYFQLAVSGDFEERFKESRFRVLVLAPSDRRLQKIRKTISTVTEKIFWFATLESTRNNFFASAWLRPASDQPKSLFETHP